MDDSTATAPLQVMHMINTGGGVFDSAGDLSSASVTGGGAFLTGRLDFAFGLGLRLGVAAPPRGT